jgi:predicted alpha/beta superfamily hydrolase
MFRNLVKLAGRACASRSPGTSADFAARRVRCLMMFVALTFAAPPGITQAAELVYSNGFEPIGPTTLIVHYPAGIQTMSARGSGGGLNQVQGVPFERNGSTFTLVLDDVEAPVSWKPLLNDVTYALGPNYVVQPGETVEVWPRFTTTQGVVTILFPEFQSTLLGNTRPIYAYLPPTYVENNQARFPVIYMHDGQNLWGAFPELAFGGITWEVDTAFDDAAASGAFPEAIVIGVASTANRLYEYTHTDSPDFTGDGGASIYLQMLVSELKPAVDIELRTYTNRESTLMAGSALGGLVTAHAGRTQHAVFGRIAALSPASWWDDAVIVDDILSTPAAPNRPLRVYVDSGDSGASSDNLATTNLLAGAYLTVGYVAGNNFLHVVQPGGLHNETYWAQRFPTAMQFLLGPLD